jgi:hypothetical protein
MAQNRNIRRTPPIGKREPKTRKPLIDPRYSNTFWTGVVIVILLIFFIINNTKEEPVRGQYPPGYDPAAKEQLNEEVPQTLRIEQ